MLETPSSSCREGHIVLQFIGIFSFLPRESLSDSLCSVFQPPKDQRGYIRLGVFYFCIPDDGVKLIPLVAPKARRFMDADAPTMEEWRKGRTAAYGISQFKKAEGEERIEEVINGVVVKHYN